MQVGGEDAACGEQALVVLALALAEQLLIPLVHQGEVGLVALEDLHALALAVQDVADGSILVSVVVRAQDGEALHGIGSAFHQVVDADTGSRDGQQADRGEDGVAAADIIGNHERGPALRVGQLLEGALGTVSGRINALVGLFHAHLIFQQLAQHAECQAGLGGGAGLGNDIDGEALALAQRDDIIQIRGADAVAAEVDLEAIVQLIVELALDGFDHSAGTQIAAADAGDDQHVGILTDLGGCFLDAGELVLIVLTGQIHPAQEIVAGAVLGFQHLVGGFHLRVDGLILFFLNKGGKVFRVQCETHILSKPPDIFGALALRGFFLV